MSVKLSALDDCSSNFRASSIPNGSSIFESELKLCEGKLGLCEGELELCEGELELRETELNLA
jgi:hypothetical protein